jgi:hypothetical protein
MRFPISGRAGDGADVLLRGESRSDDGQKKRQECSQPGEEQPDVVAGAHQDGVDRIASGSGEAVSLQQAVAFGVTDDRLDGVAPSQFSFDCRRSIARTLRHMDVRRRKPVSAVSLVDIGARDRQAGEPTCAICPFSVWPS